MSIAEELADSLGTSGRSVRRALNDGLIRGRRSSARKLLIPAREQLYLLENWPVLSGLRRSLRTEPAVGLAVLYGSFARGEADEDSDLDILVDLKVDQVQVASGVRRRLERATSREVSLARLPRVKEQAPLLLAEILLEGRVLVDRQGRWAELQSQRSLIERRAAAAYADEMAATREALDRLERRAEMVGT